MFMKKVFGLIFSVIALFSCNQGDKDASDNKTGKEMKIAAHDISYQADTVTMNGFVAYDESTDEKRPVVLIVHEWWGLNDYTMSRAKQLAEMGYLAMAVDMYGNRTQGEDPTAAGNLAMPFYKDPEMARTRFEAALNEIRKHPVADVNRIAAIGYCFGGTQVLNMARLGVPLKGVVSFHGNLAGVPADKSKLAASVLVCHGAADEFVPAEEVANFKKEMDSIGADYTFKAYSGATHAFTNPNATEMGRKFEIPIAYNAEADSASWKDMKDFFRKIF